VLVYLLFNVTIYLNLIYLKCFNFIRLQSPLLVKKISKTPTKELFATSNETIEEQLPVKQLLKKKQIQLLFPYAERQEAKTLGAKWDANLKMGYYPSVGCLFLKNYLSTKPMMFLLNMTIKNITKMFLPL